MNSKYSSTGRQWRLLLNGRAFQQCNTYRCITAAVSVQQWFVFITYVWYLWYYVQQQCMGWHGIQSTRYWIYSCLTAVHSITNKPYIQAFGGIIIYVQQYSSRKYYRQSDSSESSCRLTRVLRLLLLLLLCSYTSTLCCMIQQRRKRITTAVYYFLVWACYPYEVQHSSGS